jgi:hypothetical protein
MAPCPPSKLPRSVYVKTRTARKFRLRDAVSGASGTPSPGCRTYALATIPRDAKLGPEPRSEQESRAAGECGAGPRATIFFHHEPR